MEKALQWLGGAVVVFFAIVGLVHFLGIGVHAGGGFVGVSYTGGRCNCGGDYVSSSDADLVRRLYKN